MQILNISNEVREYVINAARSAYPEECCGFLFGREGDKERVLEIALQAQNAQEGDKKRRFKIAPFDYIKAEQFALKKGISLLGIYHSHPDHPAWPSEHDLKQAMPFFSYLIVSVQKGEFAEMASWRLNQDGTSEAEKIGKASGD